VSTINDAILACYDVCEDDKRMRDLMLSSTESTGMVFDRLRREYQLRREFGATILSRQKLESCEVTNLMRLGFRLDDTH
jgi:erythronate-4-phosphate dehydrogenase